MKITVEKLARVQMPAIGGRDAWTSVRVSFDGKTASCGSAYWNSGWKVGDEIDIQTFEKIASNGKVYLNIATPKMAEKVKESNEIKDTLARIEQKIDSLIKTRGVL